MSTKLLERRYAALKVEFAMTGKASARRKMEGFRGALIAHYEGLIATQRTEIAQLHRFAVDPKL